MKYIHVLRQESRIPLVATMLSRNVTLREIIRVMRIVYQIYVSPPVLFQ